ncbi:MAG: hypothetical protein ACI9XP_000671 [Lentimonas sp.]|jgi:hypothetical protein
MKKVILISGLFLSLSALAQEEVKQEETTQEKTKQEAPVNKEAVMDTTRFYVGKTKVIIVSSEEGEIIKKIEVVTNDKTSQTIAPAIDTIDAAPKGKKRTTEAHWSGIDFGFNVNTTGTPDFKNRFPEYKYLQNDAAKSFYINLNLWEKRFNIINEYVGLTTGLGFNFSQMAFKNNYVLDVNSDTLTALVSPVEFSKNKLKASYVQIPLLLEFNTHADNNNGLYFATGLIGGARMTSKIKREGEEQGQEIFEKRKGVFALNSFKLDATARIGHGNWGAFLNYSLLPVFDTDKTVAVHPMSFGLSRSF